MQTHMFDAMDCVIDYEISGLSLLRMMTEYVRLRCLWRLVSPDKTDSPWTRLRLKEFSGVAISKKEGTLLHAE